MRKGQWEYGNTFQVANFDFDIVCMAMEIHRRFQISYWDSLIAATASHHGALKSYEDFSPGQIYWESER